MSRELEQWLSGQEIQALDDPWGELERRIAEHCMVSEHLMDRARGLIAEDDLTVFTKFGEQMRAVVDAAERWNKGAADLLIKLGNLGLEERRVQLQAKRDALAAKQVYEVVMEALDAVGVTPELVTRFRERVAERLREA